MKTVIEMAQEAGAIRIHERPKEFAVVGNEAIERFAELVRADAIADEREACAKVCEERIEFWQRDDGRRYEDEYCADAIRARSNT